MQEFLYHININVEIYKGYKKKTNSKIFTILVKQQRSNTSVVISSLISTSFKVSVMNFIFKTKFF